VITVNLIKTLQQVLGAHRLSGRAWPYLLATAISIAIFWPTWFRLAEQWLKWEQVLAHGIPTVLTYLGLLALHPPLPATGDSPPHRLLAGVIMVGLTLCWLVLEQARIDTLAYLLLPPGIFAIAWIMLGVRCAQALLPYLLLLGLSLPVWTDLIPLLVAFATLVVGYVVSGMGITALIEGSNITLPYGRLVIADGCSGIGFLAIALLLAAITSILNDYRWKGWLATTAAAVAIALIANWVRIVALVAIAYESRMESSLVAEHEVFGWVIFALFVLPVLMAAPVQRRETLQVVNKPPLAAWGLTFLAALMVLRSIGLMVVDAMEQPVPEFRLQTTELHAAPAGSLPVALRIPEQMKQEVWRNQSGNLMISLSQIQRDSANDKVVPYLPALVDLNQWYPRTPIVDGVQIWSAIRGGTSIAISHRYQVGPFRTDNYRSAKLLQIPAIYRGQTRFALVSMEAVCSTPDCSRAVTRIQAQWKTMGF